MQTVDQFFDLKVPMSVGELNGLLRGFDNAFKEYTKHIVGKIGMFVPTQLQCPQHLLKIARSLFKAYEITFLQM